MTAQRSRKEEKIYKHYQKKREQNGEKNSCAFCVLQPDSSQIVKQTVHFRVVKNIFPYSLWDGQPVEDHLMIVPLRHTNKLGNLPAAATKEFVKLLNEYEDKRYNIYARAPASIIKSVTHQHTHLIKPQGKSRRFVLFSRKPYIRVSF